MRKITLLSLLIAILAVFPEHSLPAISSALVVREDARIEKADAIVILLGGGPERVVRAVQLYESGYAPRIVLGSGFRSSHAWDAIPHDLPWPFSSDIYQDALVFLGIPTSDIVEVDTSSGYDTNGELRSIANFAIDEEWENVILVTTASHSRRVDLIWRRISDIRHRVIAAPQPGFERWWQHGEYIRSVAYEYGALSKELYRQAAYYARKEGRKLLERYTGNKKSPSPS